MEGGKVGQFVVKSAAWGSLGDVLVRGVYVGDSDSERLLLL